MVAFSLLPHAEFGRNDHREDALNFSCNTYAVTIFQGNMSDLLFYLTMALWLRNCNSETKSTMTYLLVTPTVYTGYNVFSNT